MDPNKMIETIKESAKAGTKLGEIIEKVFGPRWTRKQADADAYADQKKLQIIRDNPDMEIAYIDDKFNAKYTPEALAFRAKQRISEESIRQENNIEKILGNTANELQSIEDISDKAVDDDWIYRFFNITKDVSNEEMQYIWGKILAGEIICPNSFSLRTLETLRNISHQEAELFQKISTYLIENEYGKFLPNDEYLLNKYEISISDIIRLEDCGFINATPIYEAHYISKNERYEYFKYAPYVIKICDKTKYNESVKDKYTFGLYPLTKAGLEISNLFEQQNNMQYAFSLVLTLKRNEKTKEIKLHKIIKEEGDIIEISSNDLLENLDKKI